MLLSLKRTVNHDGLAIFFPTINTTATRARRSAAERTRAIPFRRTAVGRKRTSAQAHQNRYNYIIYDHTTNAV